MGESSPGTAMTIERNARLREVQSWGDLFRFTIEAPAMGQEARPGQFVMVKVSDAACIRVVDGQGTPEQGEGPVRDLDHDELAGPGFLPHGRGLDREPKQVPPRLDFAEAGVALDRHSGSGARFAHKLAEKPGFWQSECSRSPPDRA